MSERRQFRTCEELDAAGVRYDACTRSACVYAQECQRRQDPSDPFNHEEMRQVVEALRATRDELSRWGFGDFHYGNMPRDPEVLDALAIANAALARYDEAKS